MNSLISNKVFEECRLPKGRKAIRSKWIYKRKRDKEGATERYKARLVAQGFSQVEGFDYNETYSPVARFTSIRFILSVSPILGLIVHQMDVETAFLNAELKEEIYMHPPVGMTVKDGHVLRLRKTLYGLKQSPREWNANLDNYMIKMKFVRINADSCVYIRCTNSSVVIIAVYVDDLIIAGTSLSLVGSVKSDFHKRYKMKDLGELQYVLGVRVDQNQAQKTIQLSQQTYIVDMLTKFNMLECRVVDTPMESKIKLSKSMAPTTPQGRKDMEQYPYREAVGSLLWIANGTRPDVAYAVSQVAKYMSNPGLPHWVAVKRILRYLKGTQDLKLTYNGNKVRSILGFSRGVLPVSITPTSNLGSNIVVSSQNNEPIKVEADIYVDADYAADVDSRRSVTGYLFMLAGAPISWQSRQQVSVALSTMESEYMAACAATQEAIWLRSLLKDLNLLDQSKPMVIREDNQACIAFSLNPGVYKKSKHIDVKFHFVRERVASKEIVLEYIDTKDQLADILTKALDGPSFTKLRERIFGNT